VNGHHDVNRAMAAIRDSIVHSTVYRTVSCILIRPACVYFMH